MYQLVILEKILSLTFLSKMPTILQNKTLEEDSCSFPISMWWVKPLSLGMLHLPAFKSQDLHHTAESLKVELLNGGLLWSRISKRMALLLLPAVSIYCRNTKVIWQGGGCNLWCLPRMSGSL